MICLRGYLSFSFANVLMCSTHTVLLTLHAHLHTPTGTFLTHTPAVLKLFFLTPPSSRLHVEQTGCPPDAALWEGLHCDEGAGRSSRGRRALQIPLREAQNVRRRRDTQPLPWLWGSRGGNGKDKTHTVIYYMLSHDFSPFYTWLDYNCMWHKFIVTFNHRL